MRSHNTHSIPHLLVFRERCPAYLAALASSDVIAADDALTDARTRGLTDVATHISRMITDRRCSTRCGGVNGYGPWANWQAASPTISTICCKWRWGNAEWLIDALHHDDDLRSLAETTRLAAERGEAGGALALVDPARLESAVLNHRARQLGEASRSSPGNRLV